MVDDAETTALSIGVALPPSKLNLIKLAFGNDSSKSFDPLQDPSDYEPSPLLP
jgi:hypothetical protein